jgi:hypothetical protein
MVNLRLVIFLALCWTWGVKGWSQDSPALVQARKDVSALTSNEFAGRGYQKHGHRIAAEWISRRMDSIGLKSLPQPQNPSHPYFQPFSFPLFQADTIELFAPKRDWTIGEDYILSRVSGAGRVSGAKVRDCGYGLPKDFAKAKGCIVVVKEGLPQAILDDPAQKEKFKDFSRDDVKVELAREGGAVGVILLKKKLTASFSQQPGKIPVFEFLMDHWEGKPKKAEFSIQAQMQNVGSQNVMGWVQGSQFPDSVILVSAHYDHLGMQGTAIFPGANDNASGIAVLLDLAAHFAKPENRPAYSMAFIAFGGEEVGLIGSRHYVTKDPIWPLASTKFILNLDLMGNGDEGITAVAGREFPTEFDLLVAINDSLKATPQVKVRGNSPNSDHYFFVEKGVHGFFVFTMGGPPHYHDVNDIVANLLFSRYDQMRELLLAFLKELQESR